MAILVRWAWTHLSLVLFGIRMLQLRSVPWLPLTTSSISVTWNISRQSLLHLSRGLLRGPLPNSQLNLIEDQGRATLVRPLTPLMINSQVLRCHHTNLLLRCHHTNLLLRCLLNNPLPTPNLLCSPSLHLLLQVLLKWIRWGSTMSGAWLIMLHQKLTSRTGFSGWATASDLAVHCSPFTSLAGWFSTTRIASSGIYLLSLIRTSRYFSASAALLNPIKRPSMGGRKWLILQLTLTSILWLRLVVAKASPEVSVYISLLILWLYF